MHILKETEDVVQSVSFIDYDKGNPRMVTTYVVARTVFDKNTGKYERVINDVLDYSPGFIFLIEKNTDATIDF